MKKICALLLCLCLLPLPVRAQGEEKLVALTFDDGPSGKYTCRLLDGLAQRDVHATFFLCGYRIEQYRELTQRIYEAGHEIGLHGYSHSSMGNMCRRDAEQEIEMTMDLMPEGCPVAFLRSPGGQCGKCVRAAAALAGLAILNWSVDPQDWATNDPKIIENRVLSRVRDGDVILLHDMSASSVEAALAIVDQLQRQGFRFVTASELARLRNVPVTPGETYRRFPPPDPQDQK